MTEWINKLIEFSFGLCETVIFFEFLSNIFNRKKDNKYIYIGIIILYSMIIYLSTNYVHFSNSKLIMPIIMLLIFAINLYEGSLKNKIVFITIAIIVMILSDIAVANILTIIMKIDLEKIIFGQSLVRIYLVCISKMLAFVILRTICNFVGKFKLDIPIKYWYMILSIFSILIIILILIGKIGVTSQFYFEKSIYFIICSSEVLAITIFVNYIFIELSKHYKKEQEYKVIELKNEMISRYYLEKEELYNETRKLRHDFKNHMICILFLIKNNKIDEAIEYIESANDILLYNSTTIKSGNIIVDAVLNQKDILAKEHNIKMDIKANVPKKLEISSVDLLSVLSNVIDNAIEASRKVNNKYAKKIDLKVSKYKDYLLIEVSNLSNANPIGIIKKFNSTKKDKRNHGLGVKIINNIVERYDGFIEYFYKDNIFTIKILMKLI